MQAVHLLVCDWLLTTRTDIWQAEQGVTTASQHYAVVTPPNELIAFQQDLANLRKIAQHFKAALPRVCTDTRLLCLYSIKNICYLPQLKFTNFVLSQVFLHEATARMMAGANPTRTQQLLDRSLRKRVKSATVAAGAPTSY